MHHRISSLPLDRRIFFTSRRGLIAPSCTPNPLTLASKHQTPLSLSSHRASLRSLHQGHETPLVIDPWASHLSSATSHEEASTSHNDQSSVHPYIAATHQLDTLLLNTLSSTSVNRVNPGDYRQVVLFTEGFDTRPFRLPFLAGTVIYLISPSECHEKAEAVLKAAGAAVPRGCLLRRIDLDLNRVGEDGQGQQMDLISLLSGLEKAGYRSDRVSCWVLQGGLEACLSHQPLLSREAVVSSVLAQIADLAAYNSILVGEIPDEVGISKGVLGNSLAGAGFLGTVIPIVEGDHEGLNKDPERGDDGHLIFSSQQMKLSLAQMGVYSAHSEEAEGLDEDFGPGNFS